MATNELKFTLKSVIYPPSNRLPFALGQTVDSEDIPPPTDPTPPKPKNPFKPLIGFGVDCRTDKAVAVGDCDKVYYRGGGVAGCYGFGRTTGKLIKNCANLTTAPFYPLANGHGVGQGYGVLLGQCFGSLVDGFVPLSHCDAAKVSKTVAYQSCVAVFGKRQAHFYHCQAPFVQGVEQFKRCISHAKQGALVGRCRSNTVLPAVGVPCRYYPIPEPPPPPVQGVCRLLPPSNRLPFGLTKRARMPSNQLPFALTCWHDDAPEFVPTVGTYIVKNTITATLGGIAFDPVSFSIRCDMNGYCWQGSVGLSPTQYAKIKHKLDTERGDEPIITVDINGFVFAIIAEDISRNRAFVNHSYTIGGRSATARLGADYAKAQTDLVRQDNYASQLINAQLADLPVTVGQYDIADWLIPSGSYAINNQTPIAVINEVVNACGGFVWSDPSLPKLHLQKRWKVNAWELAAANPDVVLSVDVVKSIADQKRVTPRYNTVTLVGQTQAGEVYRDRQGRDRIAPIDTSDLYTDRDCIIPKGQQLLSDSGTHADYTLVMRWTDKYNIKLAQLGQIWQINDPEGAFKGVVTSVAVDVRLENDAPTVWQTVGIDRYMDG